MEDDPVGQQTRETSFAALCTNQWQPSADSMCYTVEGIKLVFI